MSLGILTLLAMTFFQKLMMKIVPLQDFPIISQYFFLTSLEIGLALLVTTITLKFYHHSDKEMPRFLQIIVLNFLGKITRIRKNDDGKEALQPQLSFSSNENNTEVQPDIELTESSSFSRTKREKVGEGLNESSVGLVYYAHDRRSLSSKSSNSSTTNKDHTTEKEENQKKSAKWKEDWLLAARIVDRFSLCMSFVIGLLTIMVVFLRAPMIWDSLK